MEPPPPGSLPEPAGDVPRVIDALFRHESGRLIAILTSQLGVEHLHLAEDVVQDALLKAMETWPYTGVPQNPSVWLLQTAKHRAIDRLRRATTWRGKVESIVPFVEGALQRALELPPPQFEDEIRDSQLRMMFVCCHAELPADTQVALILKTLCGFGEREIAAAFFSTEGAIAKRLVRARRVLRDTGLSLELPATADLRDRLNVVLQALYLLFNEGYKASGGDTLLRADLCAEAIRLGELLSAHPATCGPATHALVALMHFNAARFSTRTDEEGSLLLLADQDRTRWDRREIQLGLSYLTASGVGDAVSRFHLEAGIAACHCLAPDFASTHWSRIRELYDLLLDIDASPVVALNRTIAVAYADGPAAGLQAFQNIPGASELEGYYLFHAVAGHLWSAAGDRARAEACFLRAIALARHPAEHAFLQKRIGQEHARENTRNGGPIAG